MNRCYKTGFTLIELSIVLVVIGLVVGGVLAGKEMIEAAKARRQVSQMAEYTQAMYAFRNKYDALPGDLTDTQVSQFGFSSRTESAYNGNGVIDDVNGNSGFIGWNFESLFFAMDLGAAGLVPFQAAYAYPPSIGQFPSLASNPAAGMIASSLNGVVWMCLCIYDGGHINDTIQPFAGVPVVPVALAFGVDAKMDDGIPGTGSVRAAKNVVGMPTDDTPPACVTSSSATAYNIDDGTACRLLVQLK